MMKHAFYYQADKHPLKLRVLKEHTDGSLDLGNEAGELIVGRCTVTGSKDPGCCEIVGAAEAEAKAKAAAVAEAKAKAEAEAKAAAEAEAKAKAEAEAAEKAAAEAEAKAKAESAETAKKK